MLVFPPSFPQTLSDPLSGNLIGLPMYFPPPVVFNLREGGLAVVSVAVRPVGIQTRLVLPFPARGQNVLMLWEEDMPQLRVPDLCSLYR